MSTFAQILLERELEDYSSEFYQTLYPSVSVLNEAILSASEVLDIFDTAEKARAHKAAGGNIGKAKDTYKKSIEPKLKDLADKAANLPITQRIISGSYDAISAVDAGIDKAVKEIQNKASSVEYKKQITPLITKLGAIAKNNPKASAFVAGALSAAGNMMSNGSAGEAVSAMLNGAADMAAKEQEDAPPPEEQKESIELNEGPLDFAKKLGNDVATAAKSASKSAGSKLKDKMFGSKEEVTAAELQKKWKSEYGSSTDTDDITKLLKDNGFTGLQIRKIYKKAGIDKDEHSDETGRVGELADTIKGLGIQKQVLQWMQNNKKKIYKSLSEKMIVEAKLSDKAIKDIFKEISKIPVEDPSLAKDEQEQQQDDEENQNESIRIWANQINEMPSKAEKIIATNKLFNHLTNENYTTATGTKAIHSSSNIIETLNDGRVISLELYDTFRKIIHECELSWSDFLTRPVKISEFIKFKPTMYQRQQLNEESLGRRKK